MASIAALSRARFSIKSYSVEVSNLNLLFRDLIRLLTNILIDADEICDFQFIMRLNSRSTSADEQILSLNALSFSIDLSRPLTAEKTGSTIDVS